VLCTLHEVPPDAYAYGARTALVVVDVQNDFADPEGALSVPGGADVVPTINVEIVAARNAGAKVVYSQDWHPDETPHFTRAGGPWPDHCVRGSWGAQFHPGLHVAGEVVRKGMGPEDGYSAFMVRDAASGQERPTRLDTVLRTAGIEDVVVVGLATDYCVLASALDAQRLGYRTILLERAVRAVNVAAGDGDRALRQLVDAGVEVQ
jgi:nicotinamidase/pyrazinamidase